MPTLVIGLDAMDARIARLFAARGSMPVLQRLLTNGALAELVSPEGVYVGVTWPTIYEGREGTMVGPHSWCDIDPHSYEFVLAPKDRRHTRPFWDDVAESGACVAVVDVPHTLARKPTHATVVSDWGSHDRQERPASNAAGLLDAMRGAVGEYPLAALMPADSPPYHSYDDHVLRAGAMRAPEEEAALTRLLVQAVEHKTALNLAMLSRQPWDLLVTVYGEGHAAGHQLWHVHDRHHPRHNAALAADIGSPLELVYRALDAGVGALMDAAGRDANVVVILSHGMRPHYDGGHLLEQILGRLDMHWTRLERGSKRRHLVESLPTHIQSRMGRATSRLLRHLPLPAALQWHELEIGSKRRRLRRFFKSWNNDSIGGVRLNLAGRESAGLVHPGDVDQVLDRLDRYLGAIINVDTGKPLVRRTYRTESIGPRPEADTLPDLFIEWDRRSPIERVWSPVIGLIKGNYGHWRTGDHRPNGTVVRYSPTIKPGKYPAIPAQAIGPSIAQRFGVRAGGATGPIAQWLCQ